MRGSVGRVANVAGQLAMIAVGAYLGLQAEQWREDRSKAALARATLRNFRDEIAANRATVERVRPYHDTVVAALDAAFLRHLRDANALPMRTFGAETRFGGTRTPELQTTAYELAVSTQALGELPPALALRLARVYTRQRALQGYASQFNQAVIGAIPAPRDDFARPLFMLKSGMTDILLQERRLVAQYDSALAPLDSALARR